MSFYFMRKMKKQFQTLTARLVCRPLPSVLTAVTGTNGKTSIVYYQYQIWKACGIKGASVGTIGVQSENYEKEGTLTTPGTYELYHDLKELQKHGVTHVAMETSSHGLIQDRPQGLRFKSVGFTNLTQDHLDYHKTMEAYFQAKLRLFEKYVSSDGVACLNADIPEYSRIKAVCDKRGVRVFSYGKQGTELQLIRQEEHATSQTLELNLFGRKITVTVSLMGSFQAMNLLCAIGMAVGSGLDIDKIIPILSTLHSPPGRLEPVGQKENGARILVDYAHTPDALKNILETLRPLTKGRLVVVFGCGGDRDTTKRAPMGKIANDLADIAFVTDDNPRFEEAAPIRKAILAACPKGTEIGDRRKAIEKAIEILESDDILVIAGKGHEEGQKIKGKILPFNDKHEVIRILSEQHK